MLLLLNRIKRRELYKCVFNITFRDVEKKELLHRLLERELHEFQDNLVYISRKLNYNLQNKNPINEISFYNEKNIHYAYKLKHESLILPSYFEEFTFMVYVKDKSLVPVINEKLTEIKSVCHL